MMPGPQQVAMAAALSDTAHAEEQHARYAARRDGAARRAGGGRLPDRPLRGVALPLGDPGRGLLGHRRLARRARHPGRARRLLRPRGRPARAGRVHRHRRAGRGRRSPPRLTLGEVSPFPGRPRRAHLRWNPHASDHPTRRSWSVRSDLDLAHAPALQAEAAVPSAVRSASMLACPEPAMRPRSTACGAARRSRRAPSPRSSGPGAVRVSGSNTAFSSPRLSL